MSIPFFRKNGKVQGNAKLVRAVNKVGKHPKMHSRAASRRSVVLLYK